MKYAKAITAAVTAGGGALGTVALADKAITMNEWLVSPSPCSARSA